MKAKNMMLLALLCLILVGASVAWLTFARPRNSMTVLEVNHLIQENVPIGSSRLQVEAFLDSKGIEYSYLDSKKTDLEGSSDVEFSDIPIRHLKGIIVVMIRDTSWGILVSSDIRIVFLFDQQENLIKYNDAALKHRTRDSLKLPSQAISFI